MEVILIKEEEHGLIGIATTVKAAKQWLIQEGWVTRDSIFWNFELEEGSSLGELHGDNWENAYEHLGEEDMDCLGIYLRHEKLIEEDDAMKSAWELNMNTVQKVYGCRVDYGERYYVCPICGEPIYEGDWPEESLKKFLCPICEDEDAGE